MRRIKLKKQKKSADTQLLFLVVVLSIIGIIAIADASAPSAINTFSDKYYFVKQQLVWGAIGVVGLLVASNIKYTFWAKLAKPLLFLSIIALVLVLIPGVGTRVLGAKRWIILGPASFQPSELVKLAIIIYFARLREKEKPLASYIVPLGLVAGLIMLQPDLGTTIVVVAIGMVQIFMAGVNVFHFLGIGFVGVALSFLLIITSDYRRDRLLTFLESTRDPLGKSYHIRQVLLALGSGGIFGVGLGQSRQKYLFLPEAATDSIYAVIAEEVGFVGALILVAGFVWLVYRGLLIAKQAPDSFSQVMASGIVAWIGIQAIMNIGSMVALVPLTGIPLPFISYGGSALTTILIATGILLNISKYANKQVKRK